jgi:hypothetical protein
MLMAKPAWTTTKPTVPGWYWRREWYVDGGVERHEKACAVLVTPALACMNRFPSAPSASRDLWWPAAIVAPPVDGASS